MSRGKGFSSGIGRQARDTWSGERVTPNVEQQITGFHVGQVMDDQDDQRMGRVWVDIPAISGKRFDETAVPSYGGTAPDRIEASGLNFDQGMRANWFMVRPMLPIFGADDFRSPAGPDGRNSQAGDVNSYGMWFQPRIGDYLGIMFAGGDANEGYWIGAVPKQYRNNMVPGIPGLNKDVVSQRDGSGIVPAVGDGSLLPVMDRAASPDDPLNQDRLLATDLARNIAKSGLARDPARGAGSAGAGRESPSYVMGLKSPGWTYDSEKHNRGVDGLKFEERVGTLSRVNSIGHSMVMDDHPDSQQVRLRSSGGAQIFFNDSCSTPYIYMQTQTGNVWIEMADSGGIALYAAGSISMHAEGNLNTTVDGSHNLQVDGDYNVVVGGSYRQTIAGDTAILRNGEEQRANTGEFDHTFSGASRFNYESDYDVRVAGTNTISVQGNSDTTISGVSRTNAGGGFFVGAGGVISLEGSAVHFNSGLTNSAQSAETAALPLFPKPNPNDEPPDGSQILGNGSVGTRDYLAPVVPQHQPWSGRCGVGATKGTNGLVTASPGAGSPGPSDNITCDSGALANNVRRGSSRSDATRPDNVVQPVGQEKCPSTFRGQTYGTDSSAEEPTLTPVSMATETQTHLTDSLNISSEGTDFIKSQETFIPTPTLDALGNNYVVGFGHVVQVGDVIGGRELGLEDLRAIRSNTNDVEKSFQISQAEAATFLDEELAGVGDFMETSFPTTEFTQEQYDATTSFIRNVGQENLEATPEGREYLQAVNDGEFSKAQELMAQHSHVGSSVDCDALDRRRAEIDKMGTPVGSDAAIGSIDFVPDGDTVKFGGFNMRGDVFNAIKNAQAAHPELPDGYLFAIAAQESGFDPNAVPIDPKTGKKLSSAAGLFQFIRATGQEFGLSGDRSASSNVFDVEANTNAAAAFNSRNLSIMESSVNRPINSTDLYMSHFLGAGSPSRGTGASGFLAKAEANPNGFPATDGFATQAKSNPRIFFNRDGSPKTYTEVYGNFSRKISCRAQVFAAA